MATKEKKAATGIIALPKITVKDVGGDAKKALAFDEGSKERHALMRVYGVASDTKKKVLTNPQTKEESIYEMLLGDFRAINAQTGERYQSGILYLPEGLHELISAPINQAKSENENATVRFAMDIFSTRRSNLAGYGYGATVIGEPTVPDEIARLETEIANSAAPKLAAPQ